MDRCVWKYPLDIGCEFTIDMPVDATPLKVDVQGDTPHLWALVNPDSTVVRRRVVSVATGEKIPDDKPHRFYGDFNDSGDFVYIGSVIIKGSNTEEMGFPHGLVYHYFIHEGYQEIKEEETC